LLGLRDETGSLLLPLTAVQLLWVNIITDGPTALALGFDRNPGVMIQGPRDPSARLLDLPSLRFILFAGASKALIGGALLVALPRYGYTIETTRTVVFLYLTIGQLVFAYPSRRIGGPSLSNVVLHLTIILSIGLQLLTVLIPGLRLLLKLELPGITSLLWAAAGVLLSWGIAETFVWLSGSALKKPRSVVAGV
jgi:Ca2+-transporting ATPase